MKRETADRLAVGMSFLSGAAALFYQLCLARSISLVTGGTVLAISLTLIAYLGGIAAGSYVLGTRSDRVRSGWRHYALLEIGVPAGVLFWFAASPAWDYLAHHIAPPFLFCLIPLSLLPATLCLGGTLPVLARCLSHRSTGRSIRMIYTLNLLGASMGCLVASWWLIPVAGTLATLSLGVLLNLLVATTAWSLSHLVPAQAEHQAAPQSLPLSPSPLKPLYLIAAAISGAGFLAAEIAWTRQLINLASSSTLVLGTVIGGSLLGAACGSCIVAVPFFRWKSIRFAGPLFLSGAIMLAISIPAIGLFSRYLATYVNRHSGHPTGGTIALCLAAWAVVIALFCAVLSTVFPILLQGISHPVASRGSTAGRLFAFNTIGAMLGIAAASLWGIPTIGTTACLLVISICYTVIAVPLMTSRLAKGLSVLVLVGLTTLLPLHGSRPRGLWIHAGMTHYRHVQPDDILFLEEGREATTAVTRMGNQLALSVNGLVVAETSQADLWDLLLKAHLPLLMHPHPDRVAVVGLGAGISLGAARSHTQVGQLDCIEISPGVVNAHTRFSFWNGTPTDDPRVKVHIADGRRFLHAHPHTYDVVTVDPVDPPVCNLYTFEFYRIARASLRPNGLMVQWIPLFRLSPTHFRSLLATYIAAFPNATLWYDGTSVLLISHPNQPLEIDQPAFVERAGEESVATSLRLIGGPSPRTLLATFLCGPDTLRRFTAGSTVHRDSHPALEYHAILSGRGGRLSQADNLESVISLAGPLEQPARNGRMAGADIHHIRSTLLHLGRARVARLRGKHETADQMLTTLLDQGALAPEDLGRLAPFHGGSE